jgi:hypothetical protein
MRKQKPKKQENLQREKQTLSCKKMEAEAVYMNLTKQEKDTKK